MHPFRKLPLPNTKAETDLDFKSDFMALSIEMLEVLALFKR